ncbi:(d)CMP kinase [bacterium]|nr:(d)CMP kinase [bacterium]
MIVTLDGPAGAGKSTAARLLAKKLGFEYLDTGAMYRMVTLAATREGIAPADEAKLASLLDRTTIDLRQGHAFLNGADVSHDIRTPEITRSIQGFADHPLVRSKITELTRQLADTRDIVTEGRDQGTVVFPHAECKFFITASDEIRARRRWEEFDAKGITITLEEVLSAQRERDAQDASRPIGRLTQPDDAVVIDTSELKMDDVLARLETLVQDRRAEMGG